MATFEAVFFLHFVSKKAQRPGLRKCPGGLRALAKVTPTCLLAELWDLPGGDC